MARLSVRPAARADAPEIALMVRELAEFEREPAAGVQATAADFLRDCFGDRPRCEVLIGETDGQTAGFVLFFHNYSTWLGRAGLYIEDLYVRERGRGSGLGRRLVAAVAALGVKRGCQRLELSVLHWNPARGFYERLGFEEMKEWRPYRLAGEALVKLAGEAG
jgi:ribosomal protein S18 acetylase RimI-like enzyme